MFSWKPGGGRAGEAVHFVWRIPLKPSYPDENRVFQLQTKCLANIPTYRSRVKNTVFLAIVVNPNFIHSKAVACAIYKYLNGDLLPRKQCKGKDDTLVMVEVALATQDPDLIHDLQVLNGRPKIKLFDVFWSEIKTLLESHARVDDRRYRTRRGLQMLLMLYRLANDICFDM